VSAAAVDALIVAVAIAASPPPAIAMTVILTSQRARANATAFALAWFGAILALTLLIVAAIAHTPLGDGQHAVAASWVTIIFGIALIAAGIFYGSKSLRSDTVVKTPRWMAHIDTAGQRQAALIALLMVVANPKVLLLVAAGAVALGEAPLTSGALIAVAVVFTIVASIGVLVPVVLALSLGERAAVILQGIRSWMERHNDSIMAIVCVVLGVLFAIQGLDKI
jgi:Sap, sulfolipid-1-addressing protein